MSRTPQSFDECIAKSEPLRPYARRSCFAAMLL
jgi:hypothetical protein